MRITTRFTTVLIACAIGLGTWSCGEDKSADSREQAPLSAQQQSVAAAAPVRAPSAGAVARQNKTDSHAPPNGAQWTIIVKILPGPGHVERAKQLKDELAKASGMNNWYVTHEEDQSTLYYGYYRNFDASVDPAETARLRADRDKIAALADQVGNHPFKEAMPVLINSPDPIAPPEYNLVNAKGYWSLDIAAYQGQGRKEAAIEAVLAARKMGIEAYYHHGPNVSEVCVGSWPEEAIRKQELDGSSVVDPADRDRPILLLGPGTEVPDAMKKQFENNLIDRKTGKQVEVVEQKVEVMDPTLRDAMEKYKTHSLNGYDDVTLVKDPHSGEMVSVPKPSMIVPIPHNESILQQQIVSPQPTLLDPTIGQQQQQGGQLRSIGQ